MTTFALSGMIAITLEWMNGGMKIPPEDMARFMASTYMMGSKHQKESDIYKSYSFFSGKDA